MRDEVDLARIEERETSLHRFSSRRLQSPSLRTRILEVKGHVARAWWRVLQVAFLDQFGLFLSDFSDALAIKRHGRPNG